MLFYFQENLRKLIFFIVYSKKIKFITCTYYYYFLNNFSVWCIFYVLLSSVVDQSASQLTAENLTAIERCHGSAGRSLSSTCSRWTSDSYTSSVARETPFPSVHFRATLAVKYAKQRNGKARVNGKKNNAMNFAQATPRPLVDGDRAELKRGERST